MTRVKSLPLIHSIDIQRIEAGIKTAHFATIKPQPKLVWQPLHDDGEGGYYEEDWPNGPKSYLKDREVLGHAEIVDYSPFSADELLVKEQFRSTSRFVDRKKLNSPIKRGIEYSSLKDTPADFRQMDNEVTRAHGRWQNPQFMPNHIARITLAVKEVGYFDAWNPSQELLSKFSIDREYGESMTRVFHYQLDRDNPLLMWRAIVNRFMSSYRNYVKETPTTWFWFVTFEVKEIAWGLQSVPAEETSA